MSGSPSKSKQCEDPEPQKQEAKQNIVFMKDSLLSSSNIQVISLRHPYTDQSAMYMFDKDKTKLYDMYAFDEGHRSWFVGETVQADGRLFVITPVDVTYLVLPYLMKATKNVPLDHLLEDKDIPAISTLVDVAAKRDLSHIADGLGNPELKVWKYNKEKTLSWLANRVTQLASLLQEKKVPTSTAQSFTYVRTMSLDETKVAYTVLAHGIISDYLPEGLSKSLHQHLDLPDVQVKRKTPGGPENEVSRKKGKTEGPLEDYSKNGVPLKKPNAPKTAKAKALAKSAVGSKNISSFFNKK